MALKPYTKWFNSIQLVLSFMVHIQSFAIGFPREDWNRYQNQEMILPESKSILVGTQLAKQLAFLSASSLFFLQIPPILSLSIEPTYLNTSSTNVPIPQLISLLVVITILHLFLHFSLVILNLFYCSTFCDNFHLYRKDVKLMN